MLPDSPELLAGVLAGFVTIVVTGLRCMTRPGLPLRHAKLTARQTLVCAAILIASLYGLIGIAAAIDPSGAETTPPAGSDICIAPTSDPTRG